MDKIRTSFNGGELSPLLRGRPDMAKFANGCERMEGFLPTTQGPAVACPGFRYVAEVKQSLHRTWLVRFEFSVSQAYVLEFGNNYIRFYAGRGVVESSPGVPYEVATPYTISELTSADGTFAIRYVQTGDVVYLVHPSYPPQKLTRSGPTSWAIAEVDFSPPPFRALNETAITLYASAATGSVSLTASSALFAPSAVGQYIYLAEKSVRDVKQWEAGKSITAGNFRRSNGKNYEALNTATTGGAQPSHSEGAVYDGDNGVQWQFRDPGYGWAKVTAYTSSTVVTATVVSRLPDGAVGSGHATPRWAFQAWSSAFGYPSCVAFFRERLVMARGSQLWFSVTGDFENFATEVDGEITADAGFDRTLASDKANSILWMTPGNTLLVGTNGDEWSVVEQSGTEPFGPLNVQTAPQSVYGSHSVQPVRVGSEALFVQKSKREIRAMRFLFEADGFESPDITPMASHITRSGIVDMAHQATPWHVLWILRGDGKLVGLTYNREQDVVGAHRRPFASCVDAVESIVAIPSPDGTHEDLWLIARLTIDGVTKRYVAFLEDADDEETDPADWFYVDFGLRYSGAPTSTVSGLDHLEGQEVWILADGAVHPNRTVAAGAVTLQSPASKLAIGLPSVGVLETTDLNTNVGKPSRVHRAVVQFDRTLGAKAGPTEATALECKFRSPADPMGSAPAALTGDAVMEWPADYARRQKAVVVKDKPTAVTVVSVMPQGR